MVLTSDSNILTTHPSEAHDLPQHVSLAVDQQRRAVLVGIVLDAVVRDYRDELGRGVEGCDFGEDGREQFTVR